MTQDSLHLMKTKNELSVGGKNGIAFLLSASIIWTIITVIFLQPIEIFQKNIFMLFSTGLMFPLSVTMSALIKADWKFKHIPLGSLGLYLNLAQLIYFPILFWAGMKSPNEMVLFFAVIVGAHFFPYGWLYNAKPFYIMAPVISILMLFVGFKIEASMLWLIPMSMVLLLLFLVLLLYMDYKKKVQNSSQPIHNSLLG
ncbi:DUF7010 family protein [Ectobacillus panaciterrae]|uniref:DUF7010 family protein n=1 Tax=Ectobacillus panaciterrae TaxID=363872 RepID=UPI0004008913|nr:hypothetical protein [Ectobacillus panaciterrae]